MSEVNTEAATEVRDPWSVDLVAAINGDDAALDRLGSYEIQLQALRLRHQKQLLILEADTAKLSLEVQRQRMELNSNFYRDLIDKALEKTDGSTLK